MLHSAETSTFCKTANSCLRTKVLKRRPSCLQKKTIQSGDMQKLNRYFMEGQNKDSVWKDAEKLVEFKLFGFLCVFILLAVAEKDGVSLQGSHLK